MSRRFESQNASIGDAVDVFHDDVRAPVRQGAAVHEMRDVRVIELRKDLALDLDPGMDSAGERAAEHHLDGDLLIELRIRSLGEVHLAHAADTQGAQHSIRPDSVAFHDSKHAPRRGCTANSGAPCGEALLACMKVRQECKAGVVYMTNGNDPNKPQPKPGSGSGTGTGTETGTGSETGTGTGTGTETGTDGGHTGTITPDGNDKPPQTRLR